MNQQSGMLQRTFESRFPMHMCSFFRTQEDQLSQVGPFVLSAIGANRRCVYLYDKDHVDDIVDAVARTKDLRDRVASGQVMFLSKQETYLKNGKFHYPRMISLLKDSQAQACAAGYNGAVLTGEMTWFNDSGTPPQELLEYEARVNDLFPGIEANILCQYEETAFDPGLLMDVMRTHPKVVLEGMVCPNPYYIPPQDFLQVRDGKVPWSVYQRASSDVLRRARLNLFRQEERSTLKKTGRKLQVLNDVALNDLESQLAVTQFYAELALDMCREQKMWEYVSDVVRNCELMQKQLRYASDSQKTGDEEPEWQGLEGVLWGAAMSAKLERLQLSGSLAGLRVHADPMLEVAFRGMLEFLAKGPEVKASSRETSEGLVVELSSEMRGIPENRKDSIFDRGYRDGDRTWYELSLAKTILEVSGGSIRETGDPAKSVRFEILIPKGKYERSQ